MANKGIKRTAEFYERLQKYILTPAQLKDNGFPEFVPGEPDTVTMKKSDTFLQNQCSNPNERTCVRCANRFLISNNGKIRCQHHWGRSFRNQPFSGCGCRSRSKGCVIAECHVYEDNKFTDVHGYVCTTEGTGVEEEPGVYALDCEMVFTTAGSELAKVTVVDQDLKVVYDKVVKPGNRVINHNTRFSGLTEKDLRGVTTSLQDVQDDLLRLFNDKTILVGHSLEHDFLVLKLVHRTVVDTSVVFPHRLGRPYKKGLKKLCEDYLGKRIQNKVGGHDSAEDASACMELMQKKVRMSSCY
ncbi:hypothetical protein CAPTEDRAFT_157083 [Capitella teleta]|uniref:Exonuclease domain-containing protein n=1 Tax=Capitella teleta TaxID=283909 RepID=R7UTR3_CAPTE|nr:hypothetical protein CAPTEDRAFT_157083 [Capitella teleta]|eukprot:ELU09914.1 hypothetical protein CAPTEDRAFT_157083 [Capitella teleta]